MVAHWPSFIFQSLLQLDDLLKCNIEQARGIETREKTSHVQGYRHGQRVGNFPCMLTSYPFKAPFHLWFAGWWIQLKGTFYCSWGEVLSRTQTGRAAAAQSTQGSFLLLLPTTRKPERNLDFNYKTSSFLPYFQQCRNSPACWAQFPAQHSDKI